jgi:RNA polymerase sigma factor (sigma-70 family)
MEIPVMTIRQSRTPAERFSETLYKKAFPPVAHFVSKMGGSFNEAKDIFHDALVIYCEKTADAEFTPTTTPEAYILGIARHLWLRQFKQDTRKVSLESRSDIAVPGAEETPDMRKLLSFLESTGERCMDLLRAFYYENLSMSAIAGRFGYGSERSATVQKYKCIEKIRETVKQKSARYEDFLE